MYLNGARLKEAARLRKLSREALQQRSRVDAEDMAYYWDNPVTTVSQADVDALANVLGIETDLLLVHGKPKAVPLRPDKFVSEENQPVEKVLAELTNV